MNECIKMNIHFRDTCHIKWLLIGLMTNKVLIWKNSKFCNTKLVRRQLSQFNGDS